MKKLILILSLAALFCLIKYRMEGHHLKPIGYISSFKRDKGHYYQSFRKKIQTLPPSWMQRQIDRDFTLKKISLEAIEATQQAIREKNRMMTNRYRIVDQKLYRYFDPIFSQFQNGLSDEHKAPILWFENALQTLLELTPLPNLDFIVTHEDGTKEPFYQVGIEDLQAPILGWAKTKSTPWLILIPDWRSFSFWWDNDIRKLNEGKNFKGNRVLWNEKKDIAFWRGALTEQTRRLKFASFSLEFPALIDAGISSGLEARDPLSKPHASYEEHLQYKYLPVLDGIMCSYPGYQWRLLSDSVCLKEESDQIQWFYSALNAYEHYIPIRDDLSDVIDQINWAKAHNSECKQIALNATDFVLENLMLDDVYRYLYHVFIAYSHIQDKELQKNLEITSNSPSWLPLYQSQ